MRCVAGAKRRALRAFVRSLMRHDIAGAAVARATISLFVISEQETGDRQPAISNPSPDSEQAGRGRARRQRTRAAVVRYRPGFEIARCRLPVSCLLFLTASAGTPKSCESSDES